MPATLADRAAQRYLDTGCGLYDQDVWWTGRDGIIRAIDDLDDGHRGNIARMLLRGAPAAYLRRRAGQIVSGYWAYLDVADEKGWAVTEPEPTVESIRQTVRIEQERGMDLDWLRATPLFRRMARGLLPIAVEHRAIGSAATARPQTTSGDPAVCLVEGV